MLDMAPPFLDVHVGFLRPNLESPGLAEVFFWGVSQAWCALVFEGCLMCLQELTRTRWSL